MKTITIQAGSVSMKAELNENPTAKKVWEALPVTGRANRWGDEIYFEIPVKTGQEPERRARRSRSASWGTGRSDTPSASFSGRRRSALAASRVPTARSISSGRYSATRRYFDR